MSELITRQAQGKAARAHAAQIAQLERERDAAIKVCEMAQTSGAFNVRWAETMQKRAEAAEVENERLRVALQEVCDNAWTPPLLRDVVRAALAPQQDGRAG